jgi:hypothetical protein
MASWLAPDGWLVAEEPDFGMWLADLDPMWAAHPAAWHEAFPNGSLSQGRALLRQIHRLGLADINADAELDIVLPGTALAEFYRLSIQALSPSLISAGLLTAAEAARLTARLTQPDFIGCGFAHIGAWGRRNHHPAALAGQLQAAITRIRPPRVPGGPKATRSAQLQPPPSPNQQVSEANSPPIAQCVTSQVL